MSAVVAFPRERVLHDALTPEQTLRRARLAARHAGCVGTEIERVERTAQRMIDRGLDAHVVIAVAASTAAALVREQPRAPA